MANFLIWPFDDSDFLILVNGHGHSPFFTIMESQMTKEVIFVERFSKLNHRINHNLLIITQFEYNGLRPVNQIVCWS